ncbi:MAG: TetR/AcrR family transcriptional regulator [Frankiales bacterium]|nr:TetR/AcrR family transcriptional regulator [Frankiales bacterium]
MGVRDEMSQARRTSVLRATAELLDEVGVTSLTLRQVAERAHVALGTLFVYAENKDDLLMQVYGPRMTEHWTAMLEASAGLAALERIDRFYLDCIDMYYTDKENIREFYLVSGKKPAARWEWLELLRDQLCQILAAGQRNGEIAPGVDIGTLNSAYWAMYWVAVNESYHGATEERTKEILRDTLAMLRGGVQRSVVRPALRML